MTEKKSVKQQDEKYQVGPGNPPREYQWKKGQSGNPRGRPRRKQIGKLLETVNPVAAMVINQDKKTLTRKIGGEVFEQTRGEAALEAIFALGMKGSIRSLELYWKIRGEAYESDLEIRRELFRAASIHNEHWGPKFKLAEFLGEPAPRELPHPDDIILNYETGTVDIVGPVSWNVHNAMETVVKERDRIIEAVESICNNPNHSEGVKDIALESGQAKVAEWNKLLPPRLMRDISDKSY